MSANDVPETVDAYIAQFPQPARAALNDIRAVIRKAAPDAVETIGYGVPTFKLNGNLVHFAAYARHIGLYPGASGIAAFADAFSGYKSAKGSVQFPLDRPMPLDLIARIVAFRVDEQLAKKKR